MVTDYDVVVIGAGIHGAGVAQAAAADGYSVLVLEQYDEVAQGTSSKSSKLIHGGLRYLETAQFSLVLECLRERARLLKNAPHLVKLVPFHIPVYRKTTRRPWLIMAGLFLYTLFSGKWFSRIPRSRWHELDGLSTKDLDAVFSYFDAKTDDAHLTRSVLASAQEMGADVITGATFEGAHLLDESCELEYSKTDQIEKVSTKIIVNAAGAWANKVLEKIEPRPPHLDVDLVQGAHIIVPGSIKHLYYLESPQDRRAVFVMPWKGSRKTSGQDNILIGTTENIYTGDPAEVQALDSEISYLLDVYNHYFSHDLNHNVKRGDVIDAFAGLRVLPSGEGAAFGKSRDTSFWQDRPGKPRVITMYGGKLTSYRATAEKVIERLRKTLPERERVAETRTLKLPVVD
jgi:glycerol-3-phosphate dehydrogenase